MKHTITLLIAMLGSLSIISSQNLFDPLFRSYEPISMFQEGWNQEYLGHSTLFSSIEEESVFLKPNFLQATSLHSNRHFSGIFLSTYIGNSLASSFNTTNSVVNKEAGATTTASNVLAYTPHLFANPVRDFLPVRLNSFEAENALKIYRLNGELVYETSLEALENQVDIQSLDYGYYIVEYSSNGDGWRLPLIKK